jgi:hypothetical protein
MKKKRSITENVDIALMNRTYPFDSVILGGMLKSVELKEPLTELQPDFGLLWTRQYQYC